MRTIAMIIVVLGDNQFLTVENVANNSRTSRQG